MTSRTSQPVMEAPNAVLVSIIVTNYNYGHYLEACLDSLRTQTRLPDEIIVVDDGSTDGSPDILSTLENVTVLNQPNGGQAAAFNSGFAASNGEIVIFVDADDKLHPQALEVICRLWTRDISALSYGLHMIDGQGQRIGQYAMDLPDCDLLGRLLNQLTIPFMPTSGNAFRRDAIEWAFPLPTERWRISADALLIRAGVLHAPIRQIRQVLGAYRVHGQNNYFRAGATGPWRANRGLRDIAQAGLDLITLSDRADKEMSAAHRTKLLVAAARSQMKAEYLAIDPDALFEFRRQILALCRGTRLYLCLFVFLHTAGRSLKIREWAVDPRTRTRLTRTLVDAILGARVRAHLSEEVPSRPPFKTRLLPRRPAPKDPMEWLTGPEWSRDQSTGGVDLCAAKSRFTIARAWAGPAKLSLDVMPCTGPPIAVEVFHNGLPLGSHSVKSQQTVTFILTEAKSAPPEPDVLELCVRDLVPGRFGVLSRMLRKSHRLQVHRIGLEPEPPEPPAAALDVSGGVPTAHLGNVVHASNGEMMTGERVIRAGETVSLAVPPLKPPFCLSAHFSPDQAPGDLSVTLRGQPVCQLDIGPNAECLIEMPESLTVFQGPVALEFAFNPADFLDDPVVILKDLCWLPEGAIGRYGWHTLAPGDWVGPGTGKPLADYLGEGWQHLNDATAIMQNSMAQLVFSQAAVRAETVLRLDLEPMDPLPTRDPLVVIVNVNGEQRQAVQLVGPGIVEVNLHGVLAGSSHKIEVDLFAATRPVEDDVGRDHGGLRLNALGLAPQLPETDVREFTGVAHIPDMQIRRTLLQLQKLLRDGAPIADLEQQRDALIVDVAALSVSAAFGCLKASDLAEMATLSAKLPAQKVPKSSESVPQADWLRDLSLRMLSGPAFTTLRGVVIRDLPDFTPEFARVVGAYLVADPASELSRSALQAYQDHLVEILEQTRSVLASCPEGSPLNVLAGTVVTAFRARQLLFGDLPLRPHVQAFGQALEAKLLREGHDLFAPQVRVANMHAGKVRIGIVLHNTEPSPETWIWRALSRILALPDVEVTLFLTEQNAVPASGFEGCNVVGLAGHSLAATVAALRRAQMDVMLLGANFYGHCFMAEVCAHRLAPHQMAFSAVFPATTGLSSVDAFVIGKRMAPLTVADDYVEKVLWAPGAGQTFDMPPPLKTDAAKRQITRRRVGVAGNTVMLVSGAMQDKIGPDVLRAWTQILAAAPDADLVLYPFALSWQQSYDGPAFSERVRVACKAQGIDPRRVHILPAIPNQEVKEVLAAADLYLDSFPYSGATTTVEALQCGVPLVALKGSSQRGHQAAGWLLEFGLPELVAKSKGGYVKTASDLARSTDKRVALQARMAHSNAAAMKQQAFAKWLRDHLLSLEGSVDTPPRYLFHHMPKTGGTSLWQVFSKWFDLVKDYREPWAYNMPPKLDLNILRPDQLLCGHFASDTAPLGERYPETKDPALWRKITFLRDPLERAISLHAFEKKMRQDYDQTYIPQSLGQYLRTSEGIFLRHFECDEGTWQRALDGYWFIGTLERVPECLEYLATQLGKPAPGFLPHENTSPRTEEFSVEDAKIFRANHALDFEIYDAVSARLDVLLRQHARD